MFRMAITLVYKRNLAGGAAAVIGYVPEEVARPATSPAFPGPKTPTLPYMAENPIPPKDKQ